MILDLHLEAPVVELPVVGVRREFDQEREGQHAADESLEGVKGGCLLPEHPADDIVSPIAEPALDQFQGVERGPEGIPTLGVQPGRVESGFDQHLVRGVPAEVLRDPVVIAAEVAPADEGSDQAIPAGVGEFPEDRLAEARRQI
jgi:hypothetical protein